MKRRLIALGGCLLLVGLVAWAALNTQWLYDQYVVRTTSLQPAAAQLGQQLNLTTSGDFIYRASQPQVESAEQFNASCAQVAREQSIVLGCYSGRRIFIYDVTDPRLAGVKEVTAAHELLHAVYERLSPTERQRLDELLKTQRTHLTDQRLKDTIALYERTQPSELYNELYAIFGTEVADLDPGLESHYRRYFKDRQKIVVYSQQYEQTFQVFDEQLAASDRKLEQLRSQISQLEGALADQQSSLNQQRSQLDQWRATNQLETYNQAVPAYNEAINTYNTTVAQLKQLIADYNQIVEQRNSLATSQNDLVQRLDSTYTPR